VFDSDTRSQRQHFPFGTTPLRKGLNHDDFSTLPNGGDTEGLP
jgi:hypothetical protein